MTEDFLYSDPHKDCLSKDQVREVIEDIQMCSDDPGMLLEQLKKILQLGNE